MPQPLRYQGRTLTGVSSQQFDDAHGPIHGSHASYPNELGHLASGVNMAGTQLRQHGVTATERALQLLDSNGGLEEEIKTLEMEQQQTKAELKRQIGLLNDSKAELVKSIRMNETLREMVVELRIKNEDLEIEKTAIAEKADKSLSEIEQTLDTLLMNGLSGSKSK